MLSEDGTEQLISEMIYEDDSANKQYDNVAELDDIESQLAHMDMEKLWPIL